MLFSVNTFRNLMVMLNRCFCLSAQQGLWLIFWLQVYDLSTGSRLRSLTGTYFSPFEIHTPTHQVYLVFDTDGSVTRRGWNLTYTACEFIDATKEGVVHPFPSWWKTVGYILPNSIVLDFMYAYLYMNIYTYCTTYIHPYIMSYIHLWIYENQNDSAYGLLEGIFCTFGNGQRLRTR